MKKYNNFDIVDQMQQLKKDQQNFLKLVDQLNDQKIEKISLITKSKK